MSPRPTSAQNGDVSTVNRIWAVRSAPAWPLLALNVTT